MQLILSKIRIYIQCYMLLDIIYCSSESCLHNSEGIGSVCSDSSRFFAAGRGQIYPSGQRHGWKIAWSAHPDEILKSGTRPGAIRTKLGSWCPDKNLIFGIKAFCNNPGSYGSASLPCSSACMRACACMCVHECVQACTDARSYVHWCVLSVHVSVHVTSSWSVTTIFLLWISVALIIVHAGGSFYIDRINSIWSI